MRAIPQAQLGEVPAGLLSYRPRFIKWPALAATLALMVLFTGSAGPDSDNESPAAGSIRAELSSAWSQAKEIIGHRAAVSLVDDFRSGLSNWTGQGEWTKSWSYDEAGFVRPGALAFYEPSLTLSDYHFQFQGQIEKGGLSWVYRASSPGDFYAAKLKIVKSGPLPKAVLERYAVIGGNKEQPTRMPVPFAVRQDRMYVVEVDVLGSGFTTHLDNQVIDFHSDDRLPAGGVGFLSDPGEAARLGWVSVRHQYDFLGRFCALLAPYRSFQQEPRCRTP